MSGLTILSHGATVVASLPKLVAPFHMPLPSGRPADLPERGARGPREAFNEGQYSSNQCQTTHAYSQPLARGDREGRTRYGYAGTDA